MEAILELGKGSGIEFSTGDWIASRYFCVLIVPGDGVLSCIKPSLSPICDIFPLNLS